MHREGGGEVAGKTIVYCIAEAVIVMSFVPPDVDLPVQLTRPSDTAKERVK